MAKIAPSQEVIERLTSSLEAFLAMTIKVWHASRQICHVGIPYAAQTSLKCRERKKRKMARENVEPPGIPIRLLIEPTGISLKSNYGSYTLTPKKNDATHRQTKEQDHAERKEMSQSRGTGALSEAGRVRPAESLTGAFPFPLPVPP